MAPTLFEPTTINGMTLANRFVRSATWEGMCSPEGRPTERLTACYTDLARGGVGLIISGYTFIRPEGKQLPGKMGIHCDQFAEDYRQMIGAVHDAGGKIAIQLVHAGGQTDSRTAGRQPVAPSAVACSQFKEIPHALRPAEITEIVTAFADGARRAKEYGADAVQLHGAHGYLINQFLSPHTNRRTDAYGGSLDNRARFLREVYQAVRDAVGANYPVLLKLNGADNLEGGLTSNDSSEIAAILDQLGIDAIEVSGGTPASGDQGPVRVKIDQPAKEAYNLPLARAVKERVGCPVMVVGGFRTLEVAEQAMAAGMDYISLARPLIREPGLIKRWQDGDRTPARCISCNGCFGPGLKEGGIACVLARKEATDEQEQ